MKIRHGFVSNSSTSSFLCMVCGNMEAGSDCVGMSDYGFGACENGHEFCLEHIIKEVPDSDEDGEIETSNLPPEYCPICTLTDITNDDILAYIVKQSYVDIKHIKTQIRDQFKNHDEFSKFLKK